MATAYTHPAYQQMFLQQHSTAAPAVPSNAPAPSPRSKGRHDVIIVSFYPSSMTIKTLPAVNHGNNMCLHSIHLGHYDTM